MKNLKMLEAQKGLRYLFGNELKMTKSVMQMGEEVLAQNNFDEVVTPILVDYSVIVGDKNRPVSMAKSNIVFDFKTASGEHLALRYENTLPVCKFYVDNFGYEKRSGVKRFFYTSPQFRNETITDISNRLRQFYQMGWEIIGGKESNIIEAIEIGIRVLNELKIKHSVRISEVNILGSIFKSLKLNSKDKYTLLEIIDEKDKNSLLKFFKKLTLKDRDQKLLLLFIDYSGDPNSLIKKIAPLSLNNKEILNKIYALEKIYKKLRSLGNKNIEIDLSLVRSNRFYSGVIFQYYIGNNNRECGGGGEYDRIIKSLNGPSTIACGAAFGLERVIHEYKKTNKIQY